MNREGNARELVGIVKRNGGGNFTASVYLREDGFFILFNVPFMERIAQMGCADRFCELLKTHFMEALNDAKEEKERTAAIERVQKLYGERSQFMKEDYTGFVWLYLQK